MWPTLRRQPWLFSIKAFLLFVGSIAAFVALVTGGAAEELIEGSARSYILEMHSPIAVVTTILYFILAAAYLARICDLTGFGDRIAARGRFFAWSWNLKKRFWSFFLGSWLLPLFALLALVGMTVTGALGAAIVYGPNADPFVTFIYHLFWAQ